MQSTTYQTRRGQIETYFDRVAADAWARLTSDVPVSGIRATVRAGRDEMRNTLLSYLPADLRGRRILDAGCGTGAFAVEAAKRGADVTAIDLSPTLVQLARERLPSQIGEGKIHFTVGDMLDPALGRFDHVVAMDSLIHYRVGDIVGALAQLAPRIERSMVVTFAPNNLFLATMITVGRLLPRGDRAPSIEPVSERTLLRHIEAAPALEMWAPARTRKVDRGFYKSQALEVVRA
jgi:magnesium-protoporphyrin O-methyltransferase